MATTKGTGLIMPRHVRDTAALPYRAAGSPGYTPWPITPKTGLRPGVPEGDANLLQGETPDDEQAPVQEWGAVADPGFPRGGRREGEPGGWGNRNAAHSPPFSHSPVVEYGAQVWTARPDMRVEPDEEMPFEDNDIIAEQQENIHYPSGGHPVSEARGAYGAHQANQQMSDTELSASGATGVWSIGGRV